MVTVTFHPMRSFRCSLSYRENSGTLYEFRGRYEFPGSPSARPPTKRSGSLDMRAGRLNCLAERVGFEPTDACTSPVFKTGALNRSATSPSD